MQSPIKMKKLEENPCYFLEIPKVLEEKMKTAYLVLSEYTEKYNEVPAFNNLVSVLYIIAFTGDMRFSDEKYNSSMKDKFLFQKIEDLDKYVQRNSKSRSVYSVFPYLINNVKFKNDVSLSLKELYSENEQAFNIRGLPNEFFPCVELFQIIERCLSNGGNMEVVIDLEILQHKLEILKTYSEQQ